MEGAAATNETGAPLRATGTQRDNGTVIRRRIALIALLVIVGFGAAFAIGSATKQQSAAQAAASQLAPNTGVNGKRTVAVTGVAASSAVPALKSPPKHKPKPKPSSSSSSTTAASSTPSSSASTASSTPSSSSSVSPSTSSSSSSSAPVQQSAPVHQAPAQQSPPSGGGGGGGGGGGSLGGGGG